MKAFIMRNLACAGLSAIIVIAVHISGIGCRATTVTLATALALALVEILSRDR